MGTIKKMLRRLRKVRWRTWLLATVALGLLVVWVIAWRLYRRVDEFVATSAPGPIRIFGAPLELGPGDDLEGMRLASRLRRLGYQETQGPPQAPGSYRFGKQRLEIVARAFSDPDGDHPVQGFRLDLSGGTVRSVRDLASGRDLDEASIEPELLGSYSGGVLGERQALELSQYPRLVVSAVLAAEDARFASHPGIDPLGLIRAVWRNLRGGALRQGGSTITQQLAKNLFLTPERSVKRKATEVLLALILELRMTKEQILAAYLNNVYLGQSESIGIYGIAQGARAFFGKEVRDLTVAEAATIAGIIHSPNLDSPIRHADRSRARRDQILALMAENSWITQDELEQAKREPLKVTKLSNLPLEAPFFVDEVLRRIARMGYDTNVVHGLSVYTSVDLEAQHLAEQAVAKGLADLEGKYPRLVKADAPLESALVAVDGRTGYVRALVGGRDFARSQFNRVTRSQRQPGSAFKPFVYLAAIDDPDVTVTPGTVLRDEPIHIDAGGHDWSPDNYDGKFVGDVTVRSALEDSRNVPTVEVAQRIGLGRVIELARDAGLGEIPQVPAIALGSAEVSLIDLVGAYTVFPNLGRVVRPALIRGVVASDGTMLYRDRLRAKPIATAAASYVTSHLLEGVLEEGTAASARRLGVTRTAAGKTGTTNEAKDAWFIGYSPDLIAGVWVGFDDGTPVGLTGAKAALPLWAGFMKEALRFRADRPFEVPPGVIFRDVDRRTGLLATAYCPDSIHEAFLAGTAPTTTCEGETFGGEMPSDSPMPSPTRELDWFERLFHGR